MNDEQKTVLQRLRGKNPTKLEKDAADEIERLQAKVTRLEALLQEPYSTITRRKNGKLAYKNSFTVRALTVSE